MDYGWTILLICCLTGATLFFALNAAALRCFSRVKLQEVFKTANRQDNSEYIVTNSTRLASSCSLYLFILNICIMLLLIFIFAKNQDGLNISAFLPAFIITLAIFSLFSMAIPNAWAKYQGEKILSRTSKLLMVLAVATWPVIYIIKLHDALARRLAGVIPMTPQEQQEEKQEEFLNRLQQRRMEGVVDKEEQQMIENVLELTETTADQIMTPRTDIVAIEVNSDLQSILNTITDAGHTRLPVYEENIDHIIGLVYAKDLLSQIGKNTEHFNLRDKLRQACFVPETKPLRILLHEFQSQRFHIAVVLDEYGGTAGIVTIEDILEELVGEIADEYEETPTEPVRQIDPDTIEADARTYIDDLNDRFELNLPEDEDYDTIGGFVFSHLGYIPKTGENFEYQNLTFTIISAETRK